VGGDGGARAGLSRPGGRPPDRGGSTLPHGPARPREPPDRSRQRAAGCAGRPRAPAADPREETSLWAPDAPDRKARRLAVSAWPPHVRRGEATTVSGAPEVPAGGRGPGGPRHEAPTRPQRTVRRGSWAPWGLPRATAGWAGARAAEGCAIPLRERLRVGWPPPGRWCGGAGTRRAGATRAALAPPEDGDGSPWPGPGTTAPAMDAWRTVGGRPGEADEGARRGPPQDRGPAGRAAAGEAWERPCRAPDGGGAGSARGRGGRSPRQAPPRPRGWQHVSAMRRPPGRPSRPPEGRGNVPSPTTRPAGRRWPACAPRRGGTGGSASPGPRRASRSPQPWGEGEARCTARRASSSPPVPTSCRARGSTPPWRHTAQAGHPRRSVPEAVWGSRHAERVARRGTRLTSRVPRAPRWVTRHEPMAGLTSLVPRGVRVSRVPAGVRRRSLETAPARRPGVPPEPKPKRTDTPTAERLLHAWADISLPISQQAAGADRLRRLTPWSGGQEEIRQRLGLGATLSQQLAMQAMGT